MRRGATEGEAEHEHEHGSRHQPQAAVPASERSRRSAPAQLLSLQKSIGNRATSLLIAQAKMDIGPAGDSFEREADRVANAVVSTLWNPGDRSQADDQDPAGGADRHQEQPEVLPGNILRRVATDAGGSSARRVEWQPIPWSARSTRRATPASRWPLTLRTGSDRRSAGSTSATFACTSARRRATSI